MRKLSVFALLILAMLPWSCEAVSANDLRQFVRGSWNDIRKAHAGKPTVVVAPSRSISMVRGMSPRQCGSIS